MGHPRTTGSRKAVDFKDYFLNLKSLDLLSPEYLRQPTRESKGSLGLGGQRLSAFLHELETPKRRQLLQRLKSAYPQLVDLNAKALRSGQKQLEITEEYQGQDSGLPSRITTQARHVADGMLRLIAILTETETEHRFLMFDEIENGINPELVEFVLDALVSTPQQVLVMEKRGHPYTTGSRKRSTGNSWGCCRDIAWWAST